LFGAGRARLRHVRDNRKASAAGCAPAAQGSGGARAQPARSSGRCHRPRRRVNPRHLCKRCLLQSHMSGETLCLRRGSRGLPWRRHGRLPGQAARAGAAARRFRGGFRRGVAGGV